MKSKILILSVLLVVSSSLTSKAQKPFVPYAVPVKITEKVQDFPLTSVRLLDGIFKSNKEKDIAYLLSCEPDRFLYWYRVSAGLTPKGEHYGGWDNGSGHTFAHYVTACALMYATTGDKRFLDRVNYMMDELELCQNQRKDGAIFNSPGLIRCFDQMKQGKFVYRNNGPEFPFVNNANPWYGIHKIFAALRDSYLYCHSQKAKDMMVRYANWVDDFAKPIPDDVWQQTLDVEHGGICEVIADVYAITGDIRYFNLAKRFVHQKVEIPVSQGLDMLYPHHANSTIPKFVGYQRLYELGNKDAETEGLSSRMFWDMVIKDHTLVIGGNSEYERFGPAGEVTERIGFSSAETCNSYNMLKLTDHLYKETGDMKYVDYYERTLFNHILASIDPETGMFCYFVSTKPGQFKTFSTEHTSNWCCVGTGMENPGQYESNIYAHDQNNLFVNLFISSSVNWNEKGLQVNQTTNFPDSDTMTLKIMKASAQNVTLKIRKPEWVVNEKSALLVNGKPYPYTVAANYISIDRKWKKGDVITTVLPMKLHVEATPDNPNIAAILYGPIVLGGTLGKLSDEGISPYSDDMWKFERSKTLKDIPNFIVDVNNPDKWIQKSEGKGLEFTAQTGTSRSVTLVPFYKITKDRYSVYWNMFSPDYWKNYSQAKKEYLRDEVKIGDSISEQNHHLQSVNSKTGFIHFKTFRKTENNGYFSYQLATDTNKPLFLVCKYWGGGWATEPLGVFDIFVNNIRIARKDIGEKMHETTFFEDVYPVPTFLTRDLKNIKVEFRARTPKIDNGIVGLKLVTAEGLYVPELLSEK